MRKILAAFLFTTLFLSAHAQKKTIDSLRKLIAVTKEDTSKALLINELSRHYLFSKPDSALILTQQAELLSKTVGFLKGEAISLNRQGNAFTATGNYTKALACYLSALKINEKRGDRVEMTKNLSNVAITYSSEGDYRQAINYTLRSKLIAATTRQVRSLCICLSNLGDSYEKLDMLDSAKIYTEQGYKLALKLGDPDQVGTCVNNLGNIYLKKHQLDTALYYYRKAMPYWHQADDLDGMCETTIGMAKTFRQLGRADSSLHYARQSIAAGWRGGFTNRVLAASQFLTAYFKQQNQLDSAFHYQEVSIAAKDSLYSQEKSKEFQNLTFAEHQRQQDLQEKETAYRTTIRFYLMVGVIVFFVVLAFVFWRNNKQNKKAKTQIQQTLDELKTTQTQLVQSAKMASLGELTAGIAHEIQNPLNFVNNFSEVNEEMIGELKEELKGGNMNEALAIADDIQENEKKIRHHGKRADFIVKGMLEHSRTSTGERQVTNINILADEFLKLSYHGLRAKDKNFNAELVTNFDANLPKVNVAQQDIGRVLINLFSNAFYAVNQKAKATEPGFKPTVEVITAAQNGSIVLIIKDNGTGIPDNIREKIMQPFFTTKPTGEGTGLGLSLSYDIIVKGHDGSIGVNTKEGEFTEFIVKLPL